MADKKVTPMVVNVDLKCPCCYKKIKKTLRKLPQIRDQVYNEKTNTVDITVVCCSPEKIRDQLKCKAGNVIWSIEIKEPAKTKEPEKKKESDKPKESEKPKDSEKPKEAAAADKPKSNGKPGTVVNKEPPNTKEPEKKKESDKRKESDGAPPPCCDRYYGYGYVYGYGYGRVGHASRCGGC